MNKMVAGWSIGMLVLVCAACFEDAHEAAAAGAQSVPDSANQAAIQLTGKSIVVTGKGAVVKGSRVTITAAGTYRIGGRLDEGQLIVDTQDKQRVRLVLNNASISNSTGAPIEIRKAEKVEIELAEGSVNQLIDTASSKSGTAQSATVNATLYSKEDLTISGKGALLVRADSGNGIVSKDSLKITGGNLTVNAVNDGIKGKDELVIKGGVINVTAGGDGLQAYNDTDPDKGLVRIDGGSLNIVAALDGIQAATRLTINGGVVNVTAGDGAAKGTRSSGWNDRGRGYSAASSAETSSKKGLKTGVALVIKNGKLNVDAANDALHANDTVTIDGGQIRIAAGDDGIHADKQIQINGGSTDIVQSYEGVESSVIVMNAGSLHLVAADDGVNITSGEQSFGFGRQGGGAAGNAHLEIHGGYLYVDAGGDGIDVNASMEMTGGTVLVNGPTANMNGPLDYDGSFKLTGGFLVAVGSAGMAQAPGTASTQNSVRVILPSMLAGGTPVHIATEAGKVLLTFVPSKAYQSVVVSSPELKLGETYVVYTGGQSTGKVVDGLYSVADYQGGTEAARFTVSGVVTGAGNSGFGGGMGGWGGMGR